MKIILILLVVAYLFIARMFFQVMGSSDSGRDREFWDQYEDQSFLNKTVIDLFLILYCLFWPVGLATTLLKREK